MKNFCSLFAFCIFLVQVNAQTPSWIWAKSAKPAEYNHGTSVVTDKSGNVYLAGYFQSATSTFGTYTLTNPGVNNCTGLGAPCADIFVVKYTSGGNVIWAKSFGGSSYDQLNGIALDTIGNVFITGQYQSTTMVLGTYTLTNAGTGNCVAGCADVFLAKLDSSGGVLWAKSFGGMNAEIGAAVCTDRFGNVYASGGYSSSSLAIDSYTLMNTSPNNYDYYVAKFDASGNTAWAHSAGSTWQEFAAGVATDRNANVYISGYFNSSAITIGTATLSNTGTNTAEVFLAKYDSSGAFKWAHAITGSDNDYCFSLSCNPDGNTHLGGYYASSFLIAGTTTLTNVNAGTDDVFHASYDSSGTLLWAKSLGNTGNEYCYGTFTDNNNDSYFIGEFESPSLTIGTTTLTNSNFYNLYVAKYDAAGNLLWAKGPVSGGASGKSVAAGVSGTYVTGFFYSSSATFGSTTLTANWWNVFLAKLNSGVTGQPDSNKDETVSVYPVPASNELNIESSAAGMEGIEIIDLYNSLVLSADAMQIKPHTINVAELKSGTYFVRIIAATGVVTKKITISH